MLRPGSFTELDAEANGKRSLAATQATAKPADAESAKRLKENLTPERHYLCEGQGVDKTRNGANSRQSKNECDENDSDWRSRKRYGECDNFHCSRPQLIKESPAHDEEREDGGDEGGYVDHEAGERKGEGIKLDAKLYSRRRNGGEGEPEEIGRGEGESGESDKTRG
jgi:hypothetical protein